MAKLAISVSELAQQLGISRTTAYELTRREDFPVVRVGSRALIPVAGLQKWLDEQSVNHGGVVDGSN